MAGMAKTDPWGEQATTASSGTATVVTDSVVPTITTTAATGPLEDEFSCPHCGTTLTPHHDAVGSLHCNGSSCVGCCFLPPDEQSGAGNVRAKMEAKPCPMAQKVGAF
jgi:hypothetical protein